MRFLITGGNGYLAKNLTLFLKNLEHEVYHLNRKLENGSVNYVLRDSILKVKKLKDFEDLKYIHFDGIFHFATSYAQTYSTAELSQMLEASVNLTRKLRDVVLLTQIPLIISGSYLQEVINLNNSNLIVYTSLKNLGENLVQRSSINYAVTRQFESYGEFDHRDRILNRFIDSVIQQKEFIVRDRNISLNYLHINDICAAYYHIFSSLISNQSNSRKFIISSDQSLKFIELVKATESIIGKKAKLIFLENDSENFRFNETFHNIVRPDDWAPSKNLLLDLSNLISNRQVMLKNKQDMSRKSKLIIYKGI